MPDPAGLPEQDGDRSVELMKRLLADPGLRAEFRREPEAVCRHHGLAELADQFDGQERGTMTMEMRESRSSLAGVMMAAAIEGVDISQELARAAPHLGSGLTSAFHQVLSSFASPKHGHGAPVASRASSAAANVARGNAAAYQPGAPPAGVAQGAAAQYQPAPQGASEPPAGSHQPAEQAELARGGAPAGAGSGGPVMAASAQRVGAPAGGTSGESAAASSAAQTAAGAPPAPGSSTESAAASAASADQVSPSGSTAHAEAPRFGSSAPSGGGADSAALAASEHAAEAHAAQAYLLAYPGDNAPKAQIAGWMAATAARAGLPPELPVMAALTESSLTNTPTGDRDSVGYFQMRTSIWNEGPYRGYEHDAQLQLKWFIDHALAVKAEHAGDPSYGHDPSAWGNWVADVEQPAAGYRGRYQLQLETARGLLHQSLREGMPFEAVSREPQSGETPAARALHVAMRYLGTPYVWGGSSPATGFDCSGLVQYAYSQIGVHAPRVAAEQFGYGTPVPRDQLRPGDVVFFQDSTGYVHHEGIYVGNGRFLNAPQTGENVKISSLSEPYFAQQYAGARRFAPDAPSNYARTMPVVG